MSDQSKIEWTDATWNPTTGCTKISPGCAHCYIERTPAFRIAGNKFEHGKTDLQIFHDRLEQPLRWRKPRRVFVNSLSDLFHDDISDAFILQVLDVMRRCPQHTFQLLTKRAARMRAFMSVLRFDHAGAGRMFLAEASSLNRQGQPISFAPLMKNLWLGVSVENQHFANERIPLLLKTPAAVRFISAEPLLERVLLDNGDTSWLTCTPYNQQREGGDCCMTFLEHRDRHFHGLDWVIVGGESGPGARPFNVEWGRAIVSECQRYGVPVFVKQLGARPVEWVPDAIVLSRGPEPPLHGAACRIHEIRDRKGGDPAEWPADLRVREFPASHTQERPA